MDPITLDQLRVFLSIVDTGTFSGAAKKLRRAQSAVSYAVSNLERTLGLLLFDRSTRTPTLTAQGRALVTDARAAALSVEELVEHARALSGGVEPEVSLAVDAMFPLPVVLCALAGLRNAFPEVQVTLFTEVLGGVVMHLREGQCQLGVSTPVVDQEPDLTWSRLRRVELVPVAAPSHPLALLDGVVPRALFYAETQLVVTDRSGLTAGRDFGIHSGTRWQLADLEAKHECLRAGFGWGSMPLHRVRDDLAVGRLKQLRLEGIDPTVVLDAYLVHRAAYRPGPAAKWLIEHLRTQTD